MSSAKQSVIWELQTRQLLLPKLDHDVSECEDVIALNPETRRFAVADGATEAFDARNWAERLARRWVQTDATLTSEEFCKWVATEGRELHDSWNGLNLSWYSEEKARNGSFAAFVGVEFDLETESPLWKAIALGDACLLHCHRGALLKSLPVWRSDSFNSTPVLVPSDPAIHEMAMQSVIIDSGSCTTGDVLLLMSDAAAAWCLQCFERNELDPDEFMRIKQDDKLSQFFDAERLAGRIRNDDLAILRIEIKQRRTS